MKKRPVPALHQLVIAIPKLCGIIKQYHIQFIRILIAMRVVSG